MASIRSTNQLRQNAKEKQRVVDGGPAVFRWRLQAFTWPLAASAAPCKVNEQTDMTMV